MKWSFISIIVLLMFTLFASAKTTLEASRELAPAAVVDLMSEDISKIGDFINEVPLETFGAFTIDKLRLLSTHQLEMLDPAHLAKIDPNALAGLDPTQKIRFSKAFLGKELKPSQRDALKPPPSIPVKAETTATLRVEPVPAPTVKPVIPPVVAPLTGGSAVLTGNGNTQVARDYDSSTCKWSQDIPRKIVMAPSCGRTHSNTCVGYVVCTRKSKPDLKFIRMASCSPHYCTVDSDEGAKGCTKDHSRSSRKPANEDSDFASEKVRDILSGAPGAVPK